MYMYAKFRNQIPSSFGGVGVHTDRQTHTQTHTQTDRQMRYAINNIDIYIYIKYIYIPVIALILENIPRGHNNIARPSAAREGNIVLPEGNIFQFRAITDLLHTLSNWINILLF